MKEFPILGPGLGLCGPRRARLAQAGKILGVSTSPAGHEGRIDEAVADEIAKAAGPRSSTRLKAGHGSARGQRRSSTRNMKLAEALEIQGTPAFIIDETRHPRRGRL